MGLRLQGLGFRGIGSEGYLTDLGPLPPKVIVEAAPMGAQTLDPEP